MSTGRGVPRAGYRMTARRREMLAQGMDIETVLANTASPQRANTVTQFPVAYRPHNAPVEQRFSINERFQFISDVVGMVADGHQASAIICGAGGLGKSYTVNKTLADRNFVDNTSVESFDEGYSFVGRKTYKVYSGHCSPKGLLRILFENKEPGSVIVFDDMDAVFDHDTSLNLIKAAVDSYGRRRITWMAEMKSEDIPNAFLFNGRIVFISNRNVSEIDQAVLSRSMFVDVTMTKQEMVERMEYLIGLDEFMPEFEYEYKADAITLIKELLDDCRNLSLRSLIQVTNIRRADPNGNWRQLAEYVLT